jgi:hypothetical protein
VPFLWQKNQRAITLTSSVLNVMVLPCWNVACIKWQWRVSNNNHNNIHFLYYHYCNSLNCWWSRSGVAAFGGGTKILEWRQWQGGKPLDGVIARILLCCVFDVTDGRIDILVIKVRSVTGIDCAYSPFSITCKIWWACSFNTDAWSLFLLICALVTDLTYMDSISCTFCFLNKKYTDGLIFW